MEGWRDGRMYVWMYVCMCPRTRFPHACCVDRSPRYLYRFAVKQDHATLISEWLATRQDLQSLGKGAKYEKDKLSQHPKFSFYGSCQMKAEAWRTKLKGFCLCSRGSLSWAVLQRLSHPSSCQKAAWCQLSSMCSSKSMWNFGLPWSSRNSVRSLTGFAAFIWS